MKNRLVVELIDGQECPTRNDGSRSSERYYETYSDGPWLHESGAPLYRLDKGVHKLRTEAELKTDTKYKEWANNPTLAKMEEIDKMSVAEIRKHLAAQVGASLELKALETQYQTEKEKLL